MAGERKTAIVTGAASGIGRAMTLGLLQAGVDVAAVDRNEAALAALGAIVQQAGTLLALHADLAREESFDAVVADVLSRFGKIDVLVNNAGIGHASIKPDQRRNPIRMWEITPAQWQRFLTVNATAPIMMARAVVPHMLRTGAGRVITVTTSLGTGARGLPALRREQGGGRSGDGGAGGGPERHRRDVERAGAGRRYQYRHCRRRGGRSRADAAAGDHGAAAAVADLRRGRRRDGAAVRGDGLGRVAARRSGGGEGGCADRVARDRADAGGAGLRS
jgi:hypothetical protein